MLVSIHMQICRSVKWTMQPPHRVDVYDYCARLFGFHNYFSFFCKRNYHCRSRVSVLKDDLFVFYWLFKTHACTVVTPRLSSRDTCTHTQCSAWRCFYNIDILSCGAYCKAWGTEYTLVSLMTKPQDQSMLTNTQFGIRHNYSWLAAWPVGCLDTRQKF